MSAKYLSQKRASPIPILPVYFGAVDQRPLTGPFDAIIDTGADLTVFPVALLNRVKARSTGEGQLRTVFGDLHSVTFFLIDLKIKDFTLPAVLVAGDKSVQEITLGRNILNKLAILLDGPELRVQVLGESELKRLRAKS